MLRAYAFLLLDSAGSQMVKGRERKSCIRLMKIALKAAKVCILNKDLDCATRVLERAATYEEILTGKSQHSDVGDADIAARLQLEYFAVRAALVRFNHRHRRICILIRGYQAFRQDRLDMAEHMFAKSQQLGIAPNPGTAESISDLYYEIGKQALIKNSYEAAAKWLERSCNTLGGQELGMLSSEAGELRLCILEGLGKPYDAHNISNGNKV